MRMKTRSLLLISLTVGALLLVGMGVDRLRSNRLWPFATGTQDSAFLGTTFGMSPQEARRSLSSQKARLLSYEEYRQQETSPTFLLFSPFLYEDRTRNETLYMPGIEMFESNVEAVFGFRDDRLSWVRADFDPVARSTSEAVVASLDSMLRTAYQFSDREESQEVPGAYRLRFASTSATPSLWVNLTDPEKPIISLTVLNPSIQADRQREIETRERTAFGTAR